MGLTSKSVSLSAVDRGLCLDREKNKIIAVAGNPNVGKSTLFNALTGMKQHTGNWPGKTVTNAQGFFSTDKYSYTLVDIPGTYSLMAHSAEEEVARNFICFGNPDAVIVVCDATCLERNLNLVLQTLEITQNVIVCVNLMDEAKRKKIKIDTEKLSSLLGVPVIATVARNKKTLKSLKSALDSLMDVPLPPSFTLDYPAEIERAVSKLTASVKLRCCGRLNARWVSLKLLEGDGSLESEMSDFLKEDIKLYDDVYDAYCEAVLECGEKVRDKIASAIVKKAEQTANECVIKQTDYGGFDSKLDRIITSRWAGYPLMLLLLAFVFWLTIVGANYPSRLLSELFLSLQAKLTSLFNYIGAPDWLHGALVLGVYRVLSWVVSVMLPPMAIFFPLFTLLEDLGYLPRVAYNLDRPFHACNACGKQALTMCMGFGCNAAGVVGCRIIDSPRERLLAVLTNNFVPCNGRFPALISILTMFFVSYASSVSSALLLTAVITLGIGMTFLMTKLLSVTLLKGVPSSFTLELPPYRKPQIAKTLVRSIFDRTLFVLGRAAAVAAPAGLVIWLMANIKIADLSLLRLCADFLDPFARLMGLDGVILIAFILGFPANEIVIPIIIMAYTAGGTLTDISALSELKELFVSNGWSTLTAVNFMFFCLFHFPCSTTLITVKKETGSLKWTALAALIPTAVGILFCMLTTAIFGL